MFTPATATMTRSDTQNKEPDKVPMLKDINAHDGKDGTMNQEADNQQESFLKKRLQNFARSDIIDVSLKVSSNEYTDCRHRLQIC